MYYSRRIISILISIVLALCTGGVVFAEDTASEGIEGGTTAAKQVEQEEPEVAEDPEAEPALPEAAEAEETPKATEETEATASDEVAGNDYDGEAVSEEITEPESIEIVEATSPVEASQAAPLADNEAFFTIDLNNGKVTDQNDDTVANGFAEIYGEKYSETGLKGMSDSQREEMITEMTKETEMYSIEGTDGDTAEVVSTFAFCRLIVDGKVVDDTFNTYGAVNAVRYEDSVVLCYENEEAAANAYQQLREQYGEGNVLIDLPVRTLSTTGAADHWNTNYMGFRTVAPGIKKYGDYVTVAILDSGINRNHTLINDGRKIYTGYDFSNNDSNPADDNGHGTKVASVITQSTDSNIRLLPIKISGANGGSSILNILYGVEFARLEGADVINISLAVDMTLQYSEEEANALLKETDTILARFRGPIIASAGNDNWDLSVLMSWPAISKYTFAVSALREGSSGIPEFESGYSNYGTRIDYAAPGSEIYGAAGYRSNTTTTSENNGTSFAAPHVTAAAALIMANKSTICTRSQVKTALNAVCADLGDPGKDIYYGYGCPVFKSSNFAISKNVRNISKAKVKVAAKKTYTGKALTPAPTVKYGRATLVKDKNYTLKYSNNKNVGTAKIVITGKGIRHAGKKTVTFKINPKGTTLTKYRTKDRTMTIYWKKQAKKMSKSRITGYQIQIATNSKFTKNKKSAKVKGYKNTKKKFKKLKKKTKYYVRIRTYKKTKTGTYYSPWSETVYGYSN